MGQDVNLVQMPHVALFSVAADARNGRPPYDASVQFQPFMISSSMSSNFKGLENPLRTDIGHQNMMESMFDLVLLRSLAANTTLSDYMRYISINITS